VSERLQALVEAATGELASVAALKELRDLKTRYLGKKGLLTQELKSLSSLPVEERPQFGKAVNEAKARLDEAIGRREDELKEIERRRALEAEAIDVTLPGVPAPFGRAHPIHQVLDEVVGVFTHLGFNVAEGPEVEDDWHNFEALNIPREHPARDMQDTFYVTDDIVLRTHTSPVQVRVMESGEPPIRIVAPGKVYRCDSDVTHTPMFHQIEGLYVDRGVHMGHLKGVLRTFVRAVFGPKTPMRLRPSYFPFTEPSVEVDMGCVICAGGGCRVCKGTGWLEILGAGMVHPRVFEMANIDPEEYTGYAFGLGIERIAMLKFGINDLRLFFENDVRFLGQF